MLQHELAWIVPVAPHFLHTIAKIFHSVAWMSGPMFCRSPSPFSLFWFWLYKRRILGFVVGGVRG